MPRWFPEAQISTVSSLSELNNTVTDLGTCGDLQSGVDGVESGWSECAASQQYRYLSSGGSMTGVVVTGTGASDLTLSIKNAAGAVVHQTTISGEQTGMFLSGRDGKDSRQYLAGRQVYGFGQWSG